jgi:saccharopine dehydrogenase-like NADP-dependent oxidoreductase
MAMTRRILLVGASGAFGERLAWMISGWDDVHLVLAGRRAEPLRELAGRLAPKARAEISAVTFDREKPHDLAAIAPWTVVDAAGPFQASDYRLAQAAIQAGAHYVDLADARDFVAGFPEAMDAPARAAGLVALTGASSTPALSNAAADELVRGWRGVERITVAICPGARAPRGLSVVRAILSYVGQPVRVFTGGAWTVRKGWSGPRRVGSRPAAPTSGPGAVARSNSAPRGPGASRQAPAPLRTARPARD